MIRKPIITVLGHVDHGKCVAKDTKVFLADGSIVPIEEIFEKALQNGKKLLDSDGIAVELQEPLFVFSEENNQIKKMAVSHVWKLEKDSLVKIRAENGMEIECTPEHPFPILNENFGISYVKAADLSENSFVCVPKELPAEATDSRAVKEVILERLKESDFLVFVEKEFSQNLKRIACINSGSAHYDNFFCNRLRMKDLLELSSGRFSSEELFCAVETVKQSTRKRRAGHTSKKIHIPKTDEELKELFYFAGLFFGDGDNRSGRLCNNDLELLEFYKLFSENVLGIPCVIQNGHTCLEAFPRGGKTLVKFLGAVFEIPAGKKSATIRVPKAVLIAPSNFAAAFSRGYFDTDGYVDLNNGVEISSNSREMLDGLAFLLLRFGVRCFVRKNKNAYRLTIKGAQNVQNFAERIGFSLPAKKNRLEEYLKVSGTSRVLDATPISGKQTMQLRKEFGIGNKRLKIPFLEKTESYPAVSFGFLQLFEARLQEAIKKKGSTAPAEALNRLANLSALAKGDLAFSKIVEKEFKKNNYGYVFDLTQQKTHNFVANGFLIHNTTFLDRIRGTTVAAKEAGAITQHIGATEVPIEVIRKLAGELLEKYGFKITLSGLLFIDTPGHEAFTNLRKRGGSIADLAVLVVDLTQGMQPQTFEAIDILKTFKVPFIVAANKIDKILHWQNYPGQTISASMNAQSPKSIEELDKRIYGLVGNLFEKGFQSERFDRISDFTKQIPIVPISAKTGEGIPETLMFLAGLAQRYLEKKLTIHVTGPGKATVLEVKEEKGLGKTVDAIVYDGILAVGDEIVLAGKNGVIKTKVRALLEPKPLNEIRDPKDKFNSVKEVHAAAGVKIAAPNLEQALAGSPLFVVKDGGEEALVKAEIDSIKIETDANGPIVRTDALGSLEALVKLLGGKGIKPKHADVGDVTRKDIIEALAVSKIDKFKGVVFAFNVKVSPEAEAELEKSPVKVFKENVIYKLIEDYSNWVAEEKDKEKKLALSEITWPAHLKVLPNCIFRHSKPAIVGVRVLEGRISGEPELMTGKRLVGTLKGIQKEGKTIPEAKKGDEVAVSVGEATVGRSFEENDELFTALTAEQLAKLAAIESDLTAGEKELIEEIKKITKKIHK